MIKSVRSNLPTNKTYLFLLKLKTNSGTWWFWLKDKAQLYSIATQGHMLGRVHLKTSKDIFTVRLFTFLSSLGSVVLATGIREAPSQSGCSAVNTSPVKPLRLAVGRQKSIKKSSILIDPISVMEKHVLDYKCQARVHPTLLVTFLKIPVMG